LTCTSNACEYKPALSRNANRTKDELRYAELWREIELPKLLKRPSHAVVRELRWTNPLRNEWKWLAQGYTRTEIDDARRNNAKKALGSQSQLGITQIDGEARTNAKTRTTQKTRKNSYANNALAKIAHTSQLSKKPLQTQRQNRPTQHSAECSITRKTQNAKRGNASKYNHHDTPQAEPPFQLQAPK